LKTDRRIGIGAEIAAVRAEYVRGRVGYTGNAGALRRLRGAPRFFFCCIGAGYRIASPLLVILEARTGTGCRLCETEDRRYQNDDGGGRDPGIC
jgi:hypothetical protein